MDLPLAQNEVWERIAPIVPDSLEDLGEGRYLAKWWVPVPLYDVERFLSLKGIRVYGEPYEPRSLPNGLAVQFSVSDEGRASSAWHDQASDGMRRMLSLERTGS